MKGARQSVKSKVPHVDRHGKRKKAQVEPPPLRVTGRRMKNVVVSPGKAIQPSPGKERELSISG